MPRLLAVFSLLLLGLSAHAQTLTSVSAVPASVPGGGHGELVAHLSTKASSSENISLVSTSAVANLPASLNVSAGSDVATLVYSTQGVDTTTSVTLTGTLNGSTQSTTVSVVPAAFANLVCSPSSVSGTRYSALFIYLNGLAGPSGDTVTLSSSNASVASVPSSVSLPYGNEYLIVPITSKAVDSQTSITFTATLGSTTKTATLTVNPAMLSQVFPAPSSIHAGGSGFIWTYLNAPAGPSGVTVSLSDGNPSLLSMPSSVFFPANTLYAKVAATATSGVDATTPVSITATLGSQTATGTVSITPASVTFLKVVPATVNGGNGASLYAVMNGPAGPSGLTVPLTSGNAAAATVPATLSVAPNSKHGKVAVTTFGVDSATASQISVTGGGPSASLQVLPATLAAITPAPAYQVGGTTGAGVYMYLNGLAGPSGTTVGLTSGNTAVITTPATAKIAAQKGYGYSPITTMAVGMNVPVTVWGQIGSGTAQGGPILVQSAVGSPWPKFHGNTYSSGLGIGSGTAGTALWSASSVCDPVIGTGGLVYGTDGLFLYALTSSGTPQWTDALVGGQGLAVGADGTVYVSATAGVYAIGSNGALKWLFVSLVLGNGAPSVGLDGTIYVAGSDSTLYALNPNGTLKWTYASSGPGFFHTTPAIGPDGTIYIGSGNSTSNSGFALYAINPNGSLKWSYSTVAAILSSPSIGPDGTVYVGDIDGDLYALTSSGTSKWTYQIDDGSGIYSSPAVGNDGTVYFGSTNDSLYALTSAGTLKWSFATNGQVRGSPAIDAIGVVYVASLDGNLYAVSSTGTKKWAIDIGNVGQFPNVSNPAIGLNGAIYIANGSGALEAIH